MTYTKQPLDLITRLRMSYAGKYRPLQVEAAEHKENAIRNARIAVSIRAERDQLQSKLGDAIQSSAHWQHQFTEAQAENERLQTALGQCRDAFPIPAQGSPLVQDWAAAMGEPESVPDFVKVSVDAMGKGEPVAWRFIDDKDNGHVSYSTTPPTDAQVTYLKRWDRPAWQPLYAAPKALAPLTDEQIDAIMPQPSEFGMHQPPWSGSDLKILRAMSRAIEAAHGIGGTP